MNNTTSQNSTFSFDKLTILYILYLFISSSALINSSILFLLIKSNKDFRINLSHFQRSLILAECLFAAGFFIQTLDIWRILLIVRWYTSFYCLALNFPKHIGRTLMLNFTFLLALERLASVGQPFLAKKLNESSKVKIILYMITLLFTFAFESLEYAGVDYSKPPKSCEPSDIRIDYLKPIYSYYILIMGIIVLIIYFIIWQKVGRNTKIGTSFSVEEYRKQKNLKACRLVMILMIKCLMFYVLPNFVLSVCTWLHLAAPGDSGKFVSMLAAFSPMASLLVYVWKDERARKSFYGLIGKTMTGLPTLTLSVQPANSVR